MSEEKPLRGANVPFSYYDDFDYDYSSDKEPVSHLPYRVWMWFKMLFVVVFVMIVLSLLELVGFFAPSLFIDGSHSNHETTNH